MSDGDRPLNNEWVLGPDEPVMDIWEAAFSWGRGMEPYRGTRGTVRSKVPRNVRESSAVCLFCGAPTKLIGRRLFCRACGYFESCCDGGKESVPGEHTSVEC